jgi:hypothetical protein
MVNFGNKCDGWWFEGILWGELNVQMENASGVGSVRRTLHEAFPMEEIIFVHTDRAVTERILLKGGMLLFVKFER